MNLDKCELDMIDADRADALCPVPCPECGRIASLAREEYLLHEFASDLRVRLIARRVHLGLPPIQW